LATGQKGCKATIICAPTDFSFGTFRMLQAVVLMRYEADPFIVVRSKEELAAKILKINV
jgi:hypothetical protein